MGPLSVISYIPALAAAALFLYTVVELLRHRLRLNLPPGPTPWPIIGNLNLLGRLPHRSLADLARTYGPIMYLQLGSRPAVVASSIDAAQLFLRTHDLAFASRPRTAAGKHTAYGHSTMTWSPYGPYWRFSRKLYLTELFSDKRLASFRYIHTEEVRELVRSLHSAGRKPVVLRESLWRLTAGIICRMALGRKYVDFDVGDDRPEIVSPEEFREMLDELFLLNGVPVLGDSIPWLGWLDVGGYVRRMKAVARRLDGFLERVLEESRGRLKGEVGAGAAKSLLDLLLRFAEDPTADVELSVDQVKALTMEIIAGGTESSSLNMEWAMSEMLRRPEVLMKATEEVDAVVGKERMVEEEDLASLPYIEAIVKETLRLHPAAPILTPHLSREHCNVAGYDLPSGTRLLVNVWAIQNDPAVWEDPAEFRPERFTGAKKGVDVSGQEFELLPFGAGRRMCPGIRLAMKVIQLTLATLVHAFSWELPSGMTPPQVDMEELLGLTLKRKVQIQAIAVPRLASHVYQI
ncbi:trimethyltridecatetraene synthase-like [Nymphaea colorata]|nr:trimethyltridecatetraene synthase-like [Nymphaea colorata]